MFKELAPLVRHRAVLFTVTYVDDDRFRVNVIPKKIADGENDALTTPVSVTGTVEDLDKELPQTLLHFVSSHLELNNTLERAKAEMEEASKAARAEARKKSAKLPTKKNPAAITTKPAAAPEASVPAKTETPKAVSLFDAAPEPAGHTMAVAPLSSATQANCTQSEIDEDEEILREAHADDEAENGDEAA
jgi:PRTRC genetic system protein E